MYSDKQQAGDVVEYLNEARERKYYTFSKLIMSLGNQKNFDTKIKTIFGLISARGVSVLAYIYMPVSWTLPPAIVCGDTNHVTKPSEKPILIVDEQKRPYDLYLVRMTAGACITPTISSKNTADYEK